VADETATGLRLIFRVLVKWWLLIFVGTVFALGVAGLALAMAQTSYTATADILIAQPSITSQSTAANDTAQKLVQLMPTLGEVAESDVVLSSVRDELRLTESLNNLRTGISVRPLPNTLVLRVDVRRANDAVAGEIARSLIDHFGDRVKDLAGLGPTTDGGVVAVPLRSPSVSQEPSRIPQTLLIAFLVGFGFSAVAAFALDRA
jgi:capsular polysaccharide biosynthesis protein